ADNDLLRAGSMWRGGTGWTTRHEPGRRHPFARLLRPLMPSPLEAGAYPYSDALRLELPVEPGTVCTLTLDLRWSGFGWRPRLGAVPISAGGRPVGAWVPFRWPYDQPAETWFTLSGVVAAPPEAQILELYLAVDEGVGTLDVGGVDVTERPAGPLVPLAGHVAERPGGAEYRAAGGGLELAVDYAAAPDHITAAATLSATDQADHAVAVRFQLPLDGLGWTWWEDTVEPRNVPAAGQPVLAAWRQLGDGHLYSPYPLACLTSETPARGLALAAPWRQAIVTRFGFRQEEGLFAELDLGLAPRVGRRSVSFELLVLPADPLYGFRSALAGLRRVHPEEAERRGTVAGAWSAGLNPDAAPNPRMYGLMYDEDGPAHLAWSRANRLAALAAIQPWGMLRREAGDAAARAGGIFPTDPIANQPVPESGSVHDAAGAPVAWRHDDGSEFVPWCADPALGGESPAADVGAVVAGRLQGDDGQPLAGLVVDGVASGWSGWQLDDYRDDHLKAVLAPLTVGPVTRRPAVLHAAAQTAWLRAQSDRLHGRKQILLAALPEDGELPFVTPWLDVLGCESLPSAEHFRWLRAAAGQRPVCFLDPLVLDPTVNDEELQALWNQSLLYGVFPGASAWLTMRQVSLFDTWFRRYVPILRELAEAGWDPVPHAEVDDPRVLLERYGTGDRLYLVLWNPTEERRTVTLRLDPTELKVLRLEPGEETEKTTLWEDRLTRTGQMIQFTSSLGRWQTNVVVPAGGARVLTTRIQAGLFPGRP
ncbi:MAG: hypothetical protein HYU66_09980, partial [Armatimonadetes bacterium]|nr:hypothetical protein [Armatimonadota bacterium]